jgi:cellulose biosynthesis protein BcsQ
MVDSRKSLHLEIIQATRRQFKQVLRTPVPYSSEIERITMRRAPLNAYAPGSPQGRIYAILWKEINRRLR